MTGTAVLSSSAVVFGAFAPWPFVWAPQCTEPAPHEGQLKAGHPVRELLSSQWSGTATHWVPVAAVDLQDH